MTALSPALLQDTLQGAGTTSPAARGCEWWGPQGTPCFGNPGCHSGVATTSRSGAHGDPQPAQPWSCVPHVPPGQTTGCGGFSSVGLYWLGVHTGEGATVAWAGISMHSPVPPWGHQHAIDNPTGEGCWVLARKKRPPCPKIEVVTSSCMSPSHLR